MNRVEQLKKRETVTVHDKENINHALVFHAKKTTSPKKRFSGTSTQKNVLRELSNTTVLRPTNRVYVQN
jgi:hypothetical protein